MHLFFFFKLETASFGFSCVFVFVFFFFFFFLAQRLLHYSWDMNSANRHVNSNFKSEQITGKWFFIVFSFQQNKWYPNTHSISFFLRIKNEDGDSSISRLSEPHRNFIPWAKKTQCIRYSISMSPIPIKWMLISSHKHWLSRF